MYPDEIMFFALSIIASYAGLTILKTTLIRGTPGLRSYLLSGLGWIGAAQYQEYATTDSTIIAWHGYLLLGASPFLGKGLVILLNLLKTVTTLLLWSAIYLAAALLLIPGTPQEILLPLCLIAGTVMMLPYRKFLAWIIRTSLGGLTLPCRKRHTQQPLPLPHRSQHHRQAMENKP